MFELPSLGLPVSIFLILYGVFMFFFLMYSAFNAYHLIRYGFSDFFLYLLIIVFTGGTIILVSASVIQMLQYDWGRPITADQALEYFNEDLFRGL